MTEDELKDLTEYERELWEERAAIMQFDGELSKDDAEREAFDDVLLSYSVG